MPDLPPHSNIILGPWRRSFQWLTTLLILFIPWIQPGGNSLLRIDIDSLSLHLFGQTLRIEELYLFLFFCLALALFFLLTTLVFGRVWCGWVCPQTTLSDVAEWIARRLGLKISGNGVNGALWKKGVLQASFALLSLTVGANLVWYFIEPQRFFAEIALGELHYGAWVTLAAVALPVYIDLAWVRRLMCSEFCPYGRIQTALVDPGTLVLHLPESEKSRCIECGACVRSCPMEIDIRRGYQVECINCGRCLDACRRVMKPRDQQGLIRYSFGYEGNGPRALFNPRTILLSLAMLVLCVILAAAIFNRTEASLKVSVSHTAPSRILDDGQLATFFTAWVNNRTESENIYEISANDPTSDDLISLKGQTRDIRIGGGKNRRLEFALLSPSSNQTHKVVFFLRDKGGTIHAEAEATILPAN